MRHADHVHARPPDLIGGRRCLRSSRDIGERLAAVRRAATGRIRCAHHGRQEARHALWQILRPAERADVAGHHHLGRDGHAAGARVGLQGYYQVGRVARTPTPPACCGVSRA
eukprot:scaffold3767_cov114-Isochrysis_galbana.AAC.41